MIVNTINCGFVYYPYSQFNREDWITKWEMSAKEKGMTAEEYIKSQPTNIFMNPDAQITSGQQLKGDVDFLIIVLEPSV